MVDLMRRGTTPSARCWITGVDATQYNPFNVVYGTPGDVWVSHSAEKLKPQRLETGVQVLPNGRINAADFPKVGRARTLCAELPKGDEALFEHLMSVLADQHRPDAFPEFTAGGFSKDVQASLHALQVKTPQYGTCSSSIFAVSAHGECRYLFADGPPDVTPFEDYTDLLEPH